jgi:hypothetical protein
LLAQPIFAFFSLSLSGIAFYSFASRLSLGYSLRFTFPDEVFSGHQIKAFLAICLGPMWNLQLCS